jgi:dipeptidyl aminopeptidase/acylaminoacyl peptidase
MYRASIARALACLLAILAFAAQAMTHEDLWLMPRVGPPVVSPDGRHAVFALAEPAYDPEQQAVDLWLVPTDGSAPARRITQGKGAEAQPAWSPDSRRIAFSAKREGDVAAQIYVLDLDAGGESQRATGVLTGARAPQFSPDGTRLLFVSNVLPGTATEAERRQSEDERKARKYNARVYTGFPIRNWDRWMDERKPSLFVQVIGEIEPRDLLAGTSLFAGSGYGGRIGLGSEDLEAAWAPDGRSVILAASANRDRAAYAFTQIDLWRVPVDGGEPQRLTGNPDGSASDGYGSPRFAPDGRHFYALLTPSTDRIYNATRLARFDARSGREVGRIAAPEGLSITSFSVAPDSRGVFFLAERHGHEQLFRADAGGREVRQISRLARGVFANLSGASRGREPVLLATWESAAQPPEVVRIDARNGEFRPLTAFTAERVAKLELPEAEHFWFDSARGTRIHNLLVRPPGFDPGKRYPLLVLMHGGPHTMWRDMWVLRWHYHLLAAPGYVVLLTNYTGSTGFGEAFAQGIQGDPLRGPAEEINQAADVAIARYDFIDGSRQCAGGASYGGHLANWLQASTDRYRCLISHAGLVNLEHQWGTSDVIYSREVSMGAPPWEAPGVWAEQNPIRFGANFRTPTLVTFGERDFRVPINNGLEYWAALQRRQVESRLVVFPDENHWILKGENSRFFYQELRDWLGRWLGPTPRPDPGARASAGRS